MAAAPTMVVQQPRTDRTWLWFMLALVALGGLVGAVIALT